MSIMAVQVEVLFLLALLAMMTTISAKAKCPTVPVIADFSTKLHRGTWYEIERIDNPLQMTAKCISYTYCPKRNGDMRVSYGRLELAMLNRTTTRGTLTRIDRKYPNQFKLSLEAINDLDQSVIYTDYKKHAVLYGCEGGIEFAFILSRERKPIGRRTLRRLYQYLRDLGTDVNQLITSDQTGCDVCSRVC
ncbi:apolipoprotein D-like [Mizuhopecten yessoensis]|uniref:Apolipoprotein D n=1 Tax=Mizuhopecten yessoensis TaxID=6573 RepID=A0A210QXW5_MIZYE|nr:apolipoprotein D-like [Mizuhopecten yessoensis]OWF53545.1 Apolipoprotein D [Mizuhopecten yessoensis]